MTAAVGDTPAVPFLGRWALYYLVLFVVLVVGFAVGAPFWLVGAVFMISLLALGFWLILRERPKA